MVREQTVRVARDETVSLVLLEDIAISTIARVSALR